MEYRFTPRGVCSRAIDIELEGETIKKIKFHGGCDGNLKAISLLTAGMNAREVAAMLKGNTCGFKQTSCPDQLAIALEMILEKQEAEANANA